MTVGRVFGVLAFLAIAGFLLFRYGVLERGMDGSIAISEQTLQAAEIDDFIEADTLFMRAKYDEAVGKYRKAISNAPNDQRVTEARFRIARCLEKMGRDREAAAAFGDFAKRYPNENRAQEARKKQELLSGM